jgi:hypothetical protein
MKEEKRILPEILQIQQVKCGKVELEYIQEILLFSIAKK